MVLTVSGERPAPRPARTDEGAVAILVVAMAMTLFGIAAIVVDLGAAREQKRQAQNAADAAALSVAGYMAITPTATSADAVVRAQQYVARNYRIAAGAADWASCVDAAPLPGTPVAAGNCVSVDLAGRRVRVVIPPLRSPAFFAGAIGASPPDVSAYAAATWGPGGGSVGNCTLCVLVDVSLQNGNIRAQGNVAVNGSVTSAPNGSLISLGGQILVSGAFPLGSILSPAGVVSPPFADPYAGMALPPAGVNFGLPIVSNPTGACFPGNYDDLEDCTSVAPGVYTITGEMHLAGNGSIGANGVLFYFTCSETAAGGVRYPRACNAGGEAGGTFGTVAGNGNITVSGLTSGPYADFAMISDRNNTGVHTYRGNGTLEVSGSVYAPRSTFDMRGNGLTQFCGMVLTGDVTYSGNNGTLEVTSSCPVPPRQPGPGIHLVQ